MEQRNCSIELFLRRLRARDRKTDDLQLLCLSVPVLFVSGYRQGEQGEC